MSKYRVILNVQGIEREYNPLNLDKINKGWNKEKDKVYFREELQGSLIFTGADFAELWAIEQSQDRCQPIPFRIEKQCSNMAAWELWHSGQFLLSEGDWWPDNCQVELKAAKFDAYSCIERNKSDKVNILGLGLHTYTLTLPEDGDLEYQDCTTKDGTTPQDRLIQCFTRTPNDCWQHYYHFWTDNPRAVILNDSVVAQTKWVRRKKVVPSSQSLAAPWVLLSDNGTNKTYVKPATLYNYQETNNIGNYTEYTRRWDILGAQYSTSAFDNGLHLGDVVRGLINTFCPGLTVVSDFFQINPDVESNINYVTGRESVTDNLFIYQKSDIVRSSASQNATKAELSVEELFKALETLFNVRYKIIGDTFRLEHVSWFKGGSGFNLTDPKYKDYVGGKTRYNYDKARLPKIEEFVSKGAKTADFIGKPIVYNSHCVNQDDKNNKESYSVDTFYVDFEGLLAEDSGTGDLEGFALLAAKVVNFSKLEIRSTAPILDTQERINNVLSWAHLHRDYHLHNRVMFYGELNGKLTQFKSIRRSKKGAKLTIPLCCGDVFNVEDLITTRLGAGEVDQARLNLSNETLELELMYDHDDDPAVNVPPVANNDNLEAYRGTPRAFNLLANDTDYNDNLYPCTLIITVQPTNGTLSDLTSEGRVTYTPNAGFEGYDEFKYRVKDNLGAISNEAVAKINVLVPQIPPFAMDESFTATANKTLSVGAASGLLANDGNWEGAGSFQITAYDNVSTKGGRVTVNASGSFNYTPPADYVGADSFTYTITNNQGLSDTATVSINVTDVANAPFARLRFINEYTRGDAFFTEKSFYATLIVEFFADSAYRIPATVSGVNFKYRETLSDSATNSTTTADRAIMCNGSSTVIFTNKIVKSFRAFPLAAYTYDYNSLPGVGYRI